MLRNRKGMVKRSTTLVIAFLTLILFIVCLPIPQCSAAMSSLTVEVRNQLSKEPISGATVVISGPDVRSGISGLDGKVAFSDIPSGDYDITVSVAQYPNTAPQTIYVSGKTTTMVLFAYTKAYFDYNPRQPLIKDALAFNASRSESSANITDYDWDFGDGMTGSGVAPTHFYNKSGTYTVVLTVTSDVGTATYNQLIQVLMPGENIIIFPWILLLIPLLLIPLIIFWRRRRYYVIIQVRVPTYKKNPHCPGNNTICEDCKMTPC